MLTIERNDDGRFPAYAWPGGYPIFYVTKDNGILCPTCVNRGNGSDAYVKPNTTAGSDDSQWLVVAYDANWEDPDMYCDHCNARIESAYAEPEDA